MPSKTAIVRARARKETSDELVRRALKLGATRIATRSVSPDRDEVETEFKKAADANKYREWLAKKRDIELA